MRSAIRKAVCFNGFVPLPEELSTLLYRLGEQLPGRKLMVAASGVATTDDEWREKLLVETLERVDGAVDDGIDLHGFFYDTAIDGYEWRAGFETQRGLIDRDRALKDSGRAFAAFLDRRG